ncbi:MAG: hypothetical protein WBQ14_00900 [Gaiellaceae bacterium]
MEIWALSTTCDSAWAFGWDSLVAIGTLSAVLVSIFVAIFLPFVREHRRRPQLSLTYTEPSDIVQEHLESKIIARFRLRVEAARGKEEARGVGVFVESVSERIAEGIRAPLLAGGQPLRVSYADHTTQTVPAGASRFFDLVELCRLPGMETSAKLPLAGSSVDLRPRTSYHLQLSVTGANFDSLAFTSEVVWKGELDPNGFPQEALAVTVYPE